MSDWKRGRRRIGGFSAPVIGGGLAWERLPSDREIVGRLVIRLAEKQALSAPYEWEHEDYLNQSVIEMRRFLTDALVELQPDSEPYRLVEQLRKDCNRFLRSSGRPGNTSRLRPHVQKALGRLRESFRVKLAYIAEAGGIEAARALANEIPEGLSREGPLGERLGTIYVDPPHDPIDPSVDEDLAPPEPRE